MSGKPVPRTLGAIVIAVPLALGACKKEEGAPSSSERTPRQPSASAPLVPSGAPAAPASAPSGPPTASASAAVSNDPLLAAPSQPKFKVEPIPKIPLEPSSPPLGNDWDQAVPVNSQGINSRAPMCTMLVLREWLRVFCQGHVIGYEQKSGFGEHGADYYELFVPGKSATIILRLQQKRSQTLRICRKDDRASLFVNWPGNRDRPSLLALGAGPPCDGSAWGAMATKGPAVAKKLSQDDEVDDSRIIASLKIHRETNVAAEAKCRAGDEDGCLFACGKTNCP